MRAFASLGLLWYTQAAAVDDAFVEAAGSGRSETFSTHQRRDKGAQGAT